ncbi:terminase small subunit [Streptococcus uberis]
MNERQRQFADEYIISGNAYQSAIKAGYSEKYAKARSSELLENVGIKTYIEAQVEKIQSEKVLTATEALSILSDIARGKREEEVLMMNPVTGEVSRVFKKPDNNTVIKAIVEILKRYPTSKQAEKMQLEIDKLKLQVGGDEGQDDKISNLMNKIKEAISDEPI